MNRTATTRASRGFTLIELCTGLGICAALLGQAVPAMTRLHQEQQLRAAATLLASDLRLARSEAIRLNTGVHVRISDRGAQACYVIHTGTKEDCDCRGGQLQCTNPGSQVIKAQWLAANQSIRIGSNVESLQFQRGQGLVTPTGSVDLSLENGASIRQVVSITGRTRSCYVNQRIGGLPKCN